MLLESGSPPVVGEHPKNLLYSNVSSDFEPVRVKWLAIADEVRTRIITSNEDIFIPELSF